jgi:hypothetical protein
MTLKNTNLYLVIIFLLTGQNLLFSQPSWEWAKSSIGSYTDGLSLSSDASSNVYNVGCFSSSPIIGNDTLTCWNGLDGYISKFDSAGNSLWTVTISGDNVDVVYDVSVDNRHNCMYIAGQTNSTTLKCYSTSSPVSSAMPASSGALAVPFIVKYDLSGNFLWIRFGKTPPSCANTATRVKVDKEGNAILGGTFDYYSSSANTVIFGNDTLRNNTSSTNEYEMFIVKYDSTGNVLWANQSIGGILPASQGEFIDLAVDNKNNIYFSGELNLSASVDFGNGVVINHPFPAQSQPSFLVKYDKSGNAKWAKVYGNTGATGNLYIQSIQTSYVDTSVFIHIGGNVLNGNYQLGSTALNGNHTSLLFIAKLDELGNPIWADPVSSPSAQFTDLPELFRICVDECGAAYFSGHSPWTDIHVGGVSNTLVGKVFIAKIDSAGNGIWIQTATNAPSVGCKANDIELSTNGKICITGYHSGAPPLYFGTTSLYTSASSTAVLFIAETNVATTSCSISTSVSDPDINSDILFYPNPATNSIQFISSLNRINSIQIINALGQIVLNDTFHEITGTISLASLDAGSYFIKWTSDVKSITNKLLIIK